MGGRFRVRVSTMTMGGGRLAALAIALSACSVPVASGLEEAQANQIVVALDQAGLVAEKEADPASEGRFRVTVRREDASRAFVAMREEDLPSPPSTGVLDTLGKGSLVPSQLAEHAHYVAGIAGELERTLRSIDGVQGARVHLSMPLKAGFDEGPREQPTASVLLKHRGATPPIEAEKLRHLVAGAAPGLAPDDVTVVLVPRPITTPSPDRELAQVGPITVTRGSAGLLRTGIALTALVHVALATAVLTLWTRLRRLRAEPAPAEAPAETKRAA